MSTQSVIKYKFVVQEMGFGKNKIEDCKPEKQKSYV